jgi:hypothetical protein
MVRPGFLSCPISLQVIEETKFYRQVHHLLGVMYLMLR